MTTLEELPEAEDAVVEVEKFAELAFRGVVVEEGVESWLFGECKV